MLPWQVQCLRWSRLFTAVFVFFCKMVNWSCHCVSICQQAYACLMITSRSHSHITFKRAFPTSVSAAKYHSPSYSTSHLSPAISPSPVGAPEATFFGPFLCGGAPFFPALSLALLLSTLSGLAVVVDLVSEAMLVMADTRSSE